MSIRSQVRELVALGPLPASTTATEEDVDRRASMLDSITPPVTPEEAKTLAGLFGPDDCFGVAWTLLHLIETSPGGPPMQDEPAEDANEWLQRLWHSAQPRK